MSQFMHLPLWMRFEPVLRFDCEGLLELPIPTRSEGFAEDLMDEPACEDPRRHPVERVPEHIA